MNVAERKGVRPRFLGANDLGKSITFNTERERKKIKKIKICSNFFFEKMLVELRN